MSDAPPAPATDSGVRVAVLVVVHEPDERARTVSALGLRSDLDVTAVSSIAAAREHLAAADVLVVDGDLRPKGGYSWLYELRGQAELTGGQRPPAVVLTDRDQDTFLVEWSHAERAVSKPVDPFALARAVSEVAGRRAPS
jgi:CheY-like chemotaxis protein